MRKTGLTFVALAVAIVAGLALGSAFPLQGYVAPYFFPGRCTSPDGGSATGLNNGTRAFQMLPGSTGTICVNYTFYGEGYYGFAFGLAFPEPSGALSYCNAETGASNPCEGVRLTPSPSAVEAYNGEVVTVGYTVQTSASAREGVYWLFLGDAEVVPVVIGPLNQTVQGWILECCAGPVPVSITMAGVTGVNVVLVNAG